ncbi:MAG TPA: hypothetical protein VG651_13150 [Stellaceae bacterium]|nr:hypothetical protein [Stellaceae bacterium]
MPFDGLETPFNYLPKLDQVIDLIEAPNQWIKHTYRSPWGGYCLKEALNMVGIAQVMEPAILKAASERHEREFCCIESFNDCPQTTHADVLAVLQAVREDIVTGQINLPAEPKSKPGSTWKSPAPTAGLMAKLGRLLCWS